NPAASAQAVCADFTQDHHAEFVLTFEAIISDCFVHARIPTVQYGSINPDGAERAFLQPRAPFLYIPEDFETDILYPLWIARLAADGYLTSSAKVGVLYSNNISQQRQARQL